MFSYSNSTYTGQRRLRTLMNGYDGEWIKLQMPTPSVLKIFIMTYRYLRIHNSTFQRTERCRQQRWY